MELDRESIVRTDFPTGRNGFKREQVQAHLEEVADAVNTAGISSGSLSGHIQGVLEAAELAAGEIRREAEREAAEIKQQAYGPVEAHHARVSAAARALVARIEAIEAELGQVLDDLHARGTAIGAAMAALEADVVEQERVGLDADPDDGGPASPPLDSARPAPPVAPGVPAAGPPPHVPPPQGPSAPAAQQPPPPSAPAAAKPPPPSAPAAQQPPPPSAPAAAKPPPSSAPAAPRPAAGAMPRGGDAGQQLEAARLVAFDMALGGDTRAQIDSYLEQNYTLEDRAGLLDEVMAAAGS